MREDPRANKQIKKKGFKFVWDESCEKAFVQLKNAIMNPRVLIYPDYNKTFIQTTDASNEALGASRLAKFRHKLSEYDFEILYKPGKTNLNTDALSRLPLDQAETLTVHRRSMD